MPDWDEGPKLPPANLSQIGRWYRKFEDILIPDFVAEDMVGENLTELTDRLATAVSRLVNINLPKAMDAVDPVRLHDSVGATVNNFLGQRMPAQDTLKAFACVLAGNLVPLKVGKVLEPWCGMDNDEWHAAIVVGAKRYTTPRRKIHGAILTYRVLTGPAASMEVETFLSRDGMYRMAKRVGLMAKDEFRLFHPREMVGAYNMLLLSEGDDLLIKQYYEKQSMNKRNKELATKRERARTECEVPGVGVPCHFCQMGTEACPLATHRGTYVRKMCKNGHEGWLPKTMSIGFCLTCEQKIWHARRGQ
jgi:hypothetical protein